MRLLCVILLLSLLPATAGDPLTAPELTEINWTNFRPCAKQLRLSWSYPGNAVGLKRFFVKNSFYLWSDKEKKGAWRQESPLVHSDKRSVTLKNNHLGSANKLSICAESDKGRVSCSRVVYARVPPRQFGLVTSPKRCWEKTYPVPPDLTSIRVVDVQFPNIEDEVMKGVTIKWVHKGELEFTRGFLLRIRSLRDGEWAEKVKEVSLESRRYVVEGLDYSVKHLVEVCADEKRESVPEICSKQVELKFSNSSEKSYIGPVLMPEKGAKMAPINTFGAYTAEDKVSIRWRFPFGRKAGLEFEAALFSNCEYSYALRKERHVRVSAAEMRAELIPPKNLQKLCAKVCVLGANSQIEPDRCGMLVHIKNEVVSPPKLMPSSSMVGVSLQASQTSDTATFLLLSLEHGQLEIGADLLVTCWGSHAYKGRLGGNMVRRVVQRFRHKLKSANENSLRVEGLLTDLEYNCALDGQLRDRIVVSTNDAIFMTVAGRPTAPPPPQVLGDSHVTGTEGGRVERSFSLYLSGSSEREGKPEFYDLVALPLTKYNDHLGREMYKPEFPPSSLKPLERDPYGKIPASIRHQLIARRSNYPVPFQVYRLDHTLLPLNVTFDTALDSSLWKRGKYSFLLVAYTHSGVNGSLMYSPSELSLPVSILTRVRGESSSAEEAPAALYSSDPMEMVGNYVDKAFDMTIGQLPEEHHVMVSTAGAILGYILAAMLLAPLVVMSVLYARLRMAVKRSGAVRKEKNAGEEDSQERGGGEGDAAQSDGESFYYENTALLQDMHTPTDSDYSLSSAPNSPYSRHRPPSRPLALPPVTTQQTPRMHSPTLPPETHPLAQSRHPAPLTPTHQQEILHMELPLTPQPPAMQPHFNYS